MICLAGHEVAFIPKREISKLIGALVGVFNDLPEREMPR